MNNTSSTVIMYDLTGSFAENKDTARQVRYKDILPHLENNNNICIDFSSVDLTTQSFIHALISEGVRKYGEFGVSLITFKSCNTLVKSIIRTVIYYSLEYSTIEPSSDTVIISTEDIPQANSLDTIKIVLRSLQGSKNIEQLSNKTGYSKRHIGYRLSSARILGYLDPINGELTNTGIELVNTEVGSEDERKLFINAIEDSKVYQLIAPDLLEDKSPSQHTLAKRIMLHTGMSESTAVRRANTLLSWRRQIGDSQMILRLFDLI
ncbi:MAG: STAS-like domain-containing protein [Gammaproteobacteria bacterium]|nr:STAS-like domain-containing protein [Gammaproteobacteria bacterium]